MRETEEWRPVVGFEGKYDVSNCGRVRSLRIVAHHCDRPREVPLILKQQPTENGHLLVDLNDRGRRRMAKVHQLVLEAFVGPCPDGLIGCHNNSDPSDNGVENLRWDTPKANIADAIDRGTKFTPFARGAVRGEENPRAKLTEEDIRAIRAAPVYRGYIADLGRKYGLRPASIGNIRSGRSWKHVS